MSTCWRAWCYRFLKQHPWARLGSLRKGSRPRLRCCCQTSWVYGVGVQDVKWIVAEFPMFFVRSLQNLAVICGHRAIWLGTRLVQGCIISIIKFMTPTSSTRHYLVYTASNFPLFESNHSHLILREHVDENFRPDVLTHKYSSVSSALRFNASPSMASRMQFDCESYWDFKCEYTDSLCAGCFSSIVQSKYAGQRLKNGAGCGHPA